MLSFTKLKKKSDLVVRKSQRTSEKINSDMENCYDCIFDLALFFLVKQGTEFQGSHSESSVNRSWNSETEIYVNHGVFPFIGF